jgi:hypothetical protein
MMLADRHHGPLSVRVGDEHTESVRRRCRRGGGVHVTLGENTRNELLHGFVDDPAEATATLVFVGILFLTLRVEVRPRRDPEG